MMMRFCSILSPMLIFVFQLTALGDYPFSFQTVVVSNQEVPGVPGATIGTIGHDNNAPGFFEGEMPFINASGHVAFLATIQGPGVTDDSNLVLLSGEKNSLQLIFREGNPAVGFEGNVSYGEHFRRFWIDHNGHTTSFVNITGDGVLGVHTDGLFSNTSGLLELLLVDGDDAPDVGFGIQLDLNAEFSRLGSNGHLLLMARLDGPGVTTDNDDIVYLMHDDTVETIMRQGDQAAGLPVGTTYDAPILRLAINSNGDAGFHSWLSTGQNAIFKHSNGQTEPYVISETEAPGAGLGVTVESVDSFFAFNNAGQVSFAADLDDGTGEFVRAMYSESNGTVELLAMTGQQAPGVLPSQFFQTPLYPLVNGNGETVFESSLFGALVNDNNDSGIWAEIDGELKLIVRESTLMPNSPLEKLWRLSPAGYTTEGSIFFTARIGPNNEIGNDMGLFVYRGNQVHLIVREGKIFDVDDDPMKEDFRMVQDISIQRVQSLEYGHSAGFNEAGQFAFSLQFTDSTSGVFVATPAIPGDLDGDGSVNLLDVAPFVNALNGGFYVQTGDINCDGVVNLLDVAGFVELLTS